MNAPFGGSASRLLASLAPGVLAETSSGTSLVSVANVLQRHRPHAPHTAGNVPEAWKISHRLSVRQRTLVLDRRAQWICWPVITSNSMLAARARLRSLRRRCEQVPRAADYSKKAVGELPGDVRQ